ncbi:helix-turn-helix domain-containing protein [Ferrovibrio sp.]|uniref:helix-turn-helix domain-containing protein n=1 Tax=Ferrovibrio sp. TaxID=1917215 RepID=UPI0035AEE675
MEVCLASDTAAGDSGSNQALAPVTISVAEACRITGLSRSYIYQAIKAKAFHTVTKGSRRLIDHDDLRRWAKVPS